MYLSKLSIYLKLFLDFIGINFGAYGLSVLVFPMLQQWMRKDAAKHENNLKQAIGLFTEVVKQYLIQTKSIVKFSNQS